MAESANAQGAAWAQSLGCSDVSALPIYSKAVTNNVQATCLRSLDLSELNVSVPDTGVPSYNGYVYDSWDPIVDGETIPVQPNDVGVQVPFIMGSSKSKTPMPLHTALSANPSCQPPKKAPS